jgi:type II secretory pathway component GspD/PulD (secretin)
MKPIASLALAAFLLSSVFANEPAAAGVTLVVEFIELDKGTLTERLLDHEFETDATDLRHEIQELVRNEEATVVGTAIVHTRSGQRAKTESILEVIYPTEAEKDRPAAFETRNVGITLEVDPQVGPDGQIIDVNLVPELVEHVDDVEHGPTAEGVPVKMPLFHTAKLTTSVSVPNGRYVLLGTTNLFEPADPNRKDPIVLVFLRASAH